MFILDEVFLVSKKFGKGFRCKTTKLLVIAAQNKEQFASQFFTIRKIDRKQCYTKHKQKKVQFVVVRQQNGTSFFLCPIRSIDCTAIEKEI